MQWSAEEELEGTSTRRHFVFHCLSLVRSHFYRDCSERSVWSNWTNEVTRFPFSLGCCHRCFSWAVFGKTLLLRRASRGVVHRMLEHVCCSICIYIVHVFVECLARVAALSHAEACVQARFFLPSNTSVETRERIFTSCFNCITFFSLYIDREQLCKYCICVNAFLSFFFCWRRKLEGGEDVLFVWFFSPPLIFLAQLLFRAQTCAVDLSQCWAQKF